MKILQLSSLAAQLKRFSCIIVGSSLGLCALQLNAATLQLGLSDHTGEIAYAAESNPNTIAEASWLHHEDDGDLFGIGFYVTGQRQGIEGKLGGKLFYLDLPGSIEGQGLAIGGNVSLLLAERLRLSGNLHYAPSVIAFKDVEHLQQFGLQLIFDVMNNANVFIGYRDVEIDIRDIGDIELHQGGYAGLSIRF